MMRLGMLLFSDCFNVGRPSRLWYFILECLGLVYATSPGSGFRPVKVMVIVRKLRFVKSQPLVLWRGFFADFGLKATSFCKIMLNLDY